MIGIIRFIRGIFLKPKSGTSQADEAGTLEVLSSDNKLRYFNGVSSSPVVTETHAATLENKTLDADDNTVSNLETDNLKAGVLNTSTTMDGATDTQLPSALAIKTFVENTAAAQNEASEISFDPSGTITATNVQDMGEELDSDIVAETSRATTAEGVIATNLANHIADATDAHAASAITNTPSGNLSATTVQGALNELQGDIDTINSDIADDVEGPASATDNAVARFDGTTGKLIQNSTATLDDAGKLIVQELQIDTVFNLNGTIISATNGADQALINFAGGRAYIYTTTGGVKVYGGFTNLPLPITGTGSNATLTSTNSATNYTISDGSLVSVDMISVAMDASDTHGRQIQLINKTGNTIVFNHLTGATPANQIRTPSGNSLSLPDDSAIALVYNGDNWSILGVGTLAASDVVNAPSGNLSATTVQGALNELQGDIDTGNTNLTNHIADTSTHGVTGDLVGTTDTQTLSNKTLTAPDINGAEIVSPERLDVKKDTLANLTSYAALASNGQIVFATDTKEMYQIVDGALVAVGSGSGGGGTTDVNILFQQTFEDAVIGDFTQDGLFIDTSSLIHETNCAGLSHQPAASQYFEQTVAVDPKFRGQSITMAFNIMSTATDGNVTLTVTDETNAVTLVDSEQVTFSSDITRQTVSFTVPSDCASLSYRFTALQEASFPNTYIDDIVAQISAYSLLETSVDVPVITTQTSFISQTATITNATVTGATTSTSGSGIFTYASGTGIYTATVAATINFSASLRATGAAGPQANIYKNATIVARSNVKDSASQWTSVSAEFTVAANDTFYVKNDVGNASDQQIVEISATAYSTESVTIPLTQSGIIQNPDSYIQLNGFTPARAATNSAIATIASATYQRIEGSDVTWNTSSSLGDTFVANTTGIYTISLSGDFKSTGIDVGFSKNSTQLTTDFNAINASDKLIGAYDGGASAVATLAWTGKLTAGDVVRIHTSNSPYTSASATYSAFSMAKQGTLSQVNINTNSKITIPTSELRFEGASARGAVATAIVKFDTLAKIRGDAFTVTNTANDGTFVTMTKAGRLNVSAAYLPGTTNRSIGITKNQTTLTAFPSSASEVMIQNTQATAITLTASSTFDVNVGDIIRVCADGTPSASTANTFQLDFQEQDIQVSVSNTLPQFSQSDSSVRLDTANGYGSTATKVRRFSNLRDNIGTDIVYTDSSTDGGSFRVVTSGIYSISYGDSFTGGDDIYLSKNQAVLTAGPVIGERLAQATISGTANWEDGISWTGYLNAGDVVRAVVGSATAAGTRASYFTMSKVGRPNVTGVDVTPFVNVPQPETQVYKINQATNAMTDYVNEVRFNLATATIVNSGANLISVTDDSAGARTKFTALKKTNVGISVRGPVFTAGWLIQIFKNGSLYYSGSDITTTTYNSVAVTQMSLNPGEYFTINYSGGGTTSAVEMYVSFQAEALSDQILTPIESFSTDTASLTYASSSQYTLSTLANAPVGTFITWTIAGSTTDTATQTTTAPTQTTSSMNTNGVQVFGRAYSSSSTAGNPVKVAIQIGKGMKGVQVIPYGTTAKVQPMSADLVVYGTSIQTGMYSKDYNELTGVLLLDMGSVVNSSISTNVFIGQNTTGSSTTSSPSAYVVINASKSPVLAGVPLLQPRIATISDVKSNGTAGGTATSGSYATRTLNTLDDPTGIVTSLASNQFTLPAGEYYIEASAPGYFASTIKIKLRNITDSTDQIIGTSEYSGTASTYPQSRSFLTGKVVISSAKTFEIQQRVALTSAGSGFGAAAGFSDNEVFTIVKVQKVK